MPEPIQDPVLGSITWEEADRWWRFDVGTFGGRKISGVMCPEPGWDPVSDPPLAQLRAIVSWIRANEPAIRAHITAEMFQWWLDAYYDPEIDDVTTPEGFREAISIAGLGYYSDQSAQVIYDDGDLIGGHSITLHVGPNGEFSRGPDIVG
jgi:hypothetical protein